MKQFIVGLILGGLLVMAMPANAIKVPPKPTVTNTPAPTPSFDAVSFLRRYCFGLDLIYVMDNQLSSRTPNQIAVVANSPVCAEKITK